LSAAWGGARLDTSPDAPYIRPRRLRYASTLIALGNRDRAGAGIRRGSAVRPPCGDSGSSAQHVSPAPARPRNRRCRPRAGGDPRESVQRGSVVLADATPEGGFALTGPADPAVTPSFVRPTLIMDNAAGPRKLPGGAALDLGSRYQVEGALWSGNGMLSDGATGSIPHRFGTRGTNPLRSVQRKLRGSIVAVGAVARSEGCAVGLSTRPASCKVQQ
jgi:hypothetical protein